MASGDTSVREKVLTHAPKKVQAIAEAVREKDIPLYAASLAFYSIISLVPLLIVVLWISGAIVGDDKLARVAEILGKAGSSNAETTKALKRLLDVRAGVGIFSIITGLWPASSYGAGLQRAFNELAPGRRKKLSGLRGRGLLLLALIPVFVVGSLGASFAGTTLLGKGTAATIAGWFLALVLGFGATAVGAGLIYKIFPPTPLQWSSIVKASLVTAAGVSVLSLAFTMYLNLGGNFAQHYATAGVTTFVFAALWIFAANAMLLVGFAVALVED